jgi:hypothetical protein
MKHSHNKRHRGYGVEWLQAIFTLTVLSGIAMSVDNFDSYGTTYAKNQPTAHSVSGAYWNETLGYGFRWTSGDSYKNSTGSSIDVVVISPTDGLVYKDSTVKVSFYTKDSIKEIEKKHTEDVPRTYSRLPNGIAVIEWDLASSRAKTILATLHSR